MLSTITGVYKVLLGIVFVLFHFYLFLIHICCFCFWFSNIMARRARRREPIPPCYAPTEMRQNYVKTLTIFFTHLPSSADKCQILESNVVLNRLCRVAISDRGIGSVRLHAGRKLVPTPNLPSAGRCGGDDKTQKRKLPPRMNQSCQSSLFPLLQ